MRENGARVFDVEHTRHPSVCFLVPLSISFTRFMRSTECYAKGGLAARLSAPATIRDSVEDETFSSMFLTSVFSSRC